MTKNEAILRLQEWFPDGSTVFLVLRNVSKSGMSREIGVVQLEADKDGRIIDLHPNYAVSQALGWPMSKHNHDGIRVRGCGMDMGFHLVDTLSHVIGRKLTHRWL